MTAQLAVHTCCAVSDFITDIPLPRSPCCREESMLHSFNWVSEKVWTWVHYQKWEVMHQCKVEAGIKMHMLKTDGRSRKENTQCHGWWRPSPSKPSSQTKKNANTCGDGASKLGVLQWYDAQTNSRLFNSVWEMAAEPGVWSHASYGWWAKMQNIVL